jgi:hypothetical protein
MFIKVVRDHLSQTGMQIDCVSVDIRVAIRHSDSTPIILTDPWEIFLEGELRYGGVSFCLSGSIGISWSVERIIRDASASCSRSNIQDGATWGWYESCGLKCCLRQRWVLLRGTRSDLKSGHHLNMT